MIGFTNPLAGALDLSFGLITLLILGGYALVVRSWIKRWKQVPDRPWSIVEPERAGLTAIIPCRNEAANLAHLLDDLSRQTLSIQAIVVDDGSDDETIQIAQKAGVTVIRSPSPGKKSALLAGIEHAQTEWVATLDADVRIGTKWAEAMVMAAVVEEASAVIGSVVIVPHKSPWDRFQALEYGAMMLWIGGGVDAKGLAMGSGANLLFKREKYPIHSLMLSVASGDDSFALEAIRKNKGRLVWQGDHRARALTSGVHSWPEIWRQRGRWASKSTHLKDAESKRIAVMIGTVQSALIVWVLIAIFSWNTFVSFAVLTLWLMKAAIDCYLLRMVSTAFNIPVKKRDYFEFTPRYLTLVFGAWITILRRKVVWKGRPI